MAKGEFSSVLVSRMKEKPSIKNVWINEDGEWFFHETKGFEKFSRSEVLGKKEDKSSDEKTVKPYSKMNVDELTVVCVEKQIPEAEYVGLKKADIVALLEKKDLES